MSITTNRTDPRLKEHDASGQQEAYLVLSEQELAKGFVRPVRYRYTHTACGTETTMGAKIAETYARDPGFYGGTFCVGCGGHFPLLEVVDGKERRTFLWDDGTGVGI